MNPISFTPSGTLGAIFTALTTAFRSSWKTRKPDGETAHPDHKFPDISDGTCFTPTESPAELASTPSPVLVTAEGYAGLLRDIPILVVDDNPIHQQIAARILECAGATVTVAANGEQAVSILEREQYELIIMDLLMPVMDGYAATRCLQAGMNDYILKPYELSKLFECITRLLNLPANKTDF